MREDTKKKIELIVWHAMRSAAMINMSPEEYRAARKNPAAKINISLEDYKAQPPSVERSYNLIYLSNAVNDIMMHVEEYP